MKKLYFLSLIIATAAMFFGCKKDDNEEPTPQIKLDSTEVKNLINSNFFFNGEYHKPKSGSTNCRCFNNPISIAVEQKIYEPIVIKVHDTVSYTYRYQITNCSITDASGENMATEYIPNEATYILNISHKDLKPNTEYTVDVTLTLTQLVNGEWKPVEYKRYTPNYSCKVKFTTGDLPGNTLDAQDILYQYPIDRQLNYLTEEYKQGYIMLSYNYKNIFDNTSDADKKIVIKSISDADFTDKTINYTVTESHEVENQEIEINYSLENVQFNKHQIYSLEFYCKDNVIYTMYFRTSKYATAEEKFKTFAEWADGDAFIASTTNAQLKVIRKKIDNMEFDIFELPSTNKFALASTNESSTYGLNFRKSLIALKADLDNCEWYQNSIYKLLYDTYPLEPFSGQRDYNEYPPADAITMQNSEILYFGYLSDEDIENKNAEKELDPEGNIGLYLVFQMDKDLRDRINKLQLQHDFDNELLEYREPPRYSNGSYPYFISYRLPGKNIITYTEKHALIVE